MAMTALRYLLTITVINDIGKMTAYNTVNSPD